MIPSKAGLALSYTDLIVSLPESVFMRHLSLTLLASALLCTASASWAQARKPAAPDASSAPASAAKAESRTELEIDPSQPHIQAAMKKGRTTASEVLKVAATGDEKRYENVAVRVLVREGKLQEFIWLQPIEKTDKGYVGYVATIPVVLQRMQVRMSYTFKPEDIVDWMYTDKLKKTMHGQFITCAQVKKEAPQDAAVLKRRYGLDCSR